MMVQSDAYSRAFNQLCHMMSLSKDGRVEEAIDNLVLTILYMEPNLKFDKHIQKALSTQFGTTLTVNQVSESIERIDNAGKLTAINPVVLSVEARQAIEERVRDSETLEKKVKSDWFDLIQLQNESDDQILESLWLSLKEYMAQVFKQHGVQTIRFFDPAFQVDDEINVSLDTFRKNAYEKFTEIHKSIEFSVFQELIELFSNLNSPSKTRYISQSLDSTFTFFALNAAEDLSKFLQSSIPDLTILIDTNFIYELIGLDEKSRDGLSKELISIIKDNNLPIKLYFHPETRGEYLRTFNAASRELRYYPDKDMLRPKWTSHQSSYQLLRGNVSAIARKYHQLNSKRPESLDVFLEKYSQFDLLLSAYGISEYLNPPNLKYRQVQSLSYDYEAYLPNEIYKSKSVINHDITLMKMVEEIRNPNARGLSVGAFFLTNDNQLYSFDWYYIRNYGVTGVTIQPGQFLQLLRPLIKTTSNFDKRFVETFTKTSFRSAATKYTGQMEQTLLSYLSQYADVPQEIAIQMLSNAYFIESLKQYETDSQEFRSAIEDEIAKQQTAALKAKIQHSQELEQTIQNLQKQMEDLQSQRKSEIIATQEYKAKLEELQELLEKLEKEQETPQVAVQLPDDGGTSREEELNAQIERERVKFRILIGTIVGIVGLLIIWIIPSFITWNWLESHQNRLGLLSSATLIILGLAWAIADKERRQIALGALVLGAVLVIPQIIGG